MTAPACIHGCDGVWISTPSGLMPCPKHALAAHERWLSDTAAARRRRVVADTTRPTPTPEVHEAIARIWATIPRPERKERKP